MAHRTESASRAGLGWFLATLLVGATLLAGLGGLVYRAEVAAMDSRFASEQRELLGRLRLTVEREFASVRADLRALAARTDWRLAFGASGDPADHAAALERLAADLLEFAASKPAYARVVAFDAAGVERLRIASIDGATRRVPVDPSRSLAIHPVLDLPAGAVRLTTDPRDAMPESTDGSMPTLARFAIPLRAPRDGAVLGALAFDDRGQALLDALAAVGGEPDRLALLQLGADWPAHPASDLFASEPRARTEIDAALAAHLAAKPGSGGQIRLPFALLTFVAFDPLPDDEMAIPGDGAPWVLVSQVPEAAFAAARGDLRARLAWPAIALLAGILVLAWLLAWLLARHRREQQQLRIMADFDQLTELPNRHLFFDRLERIHAHAARYRRRYALIYLSLRGFRQINDNYGQVVGDELLIRIARLLVHSLRDADTVGRLGSDEYGVLLSDVSDVKAALRIGEKMVAAIQAPIRLSVGDVEIGANVGVAVFPEHADSLNAMIALIGQALEYSRELGVNRCVEAVFQPQSHPEELF